MAIGRVAQLVLAIAVFGFTVLASGEESTNSQGATDKRYVAALAKNGRLPLKFNHRSEDKRKDGEDTLADNHEEHQGQESPSEAEDPDLFYFNDEDAGSRESGPNDKRYLGAFLKSRGKPRSPEDELEDVQDVEKRHIGAFFNSRGKPSEIDQLNGKRNIASLARKGWLSAIRSYRMPLGHVVSSPRRYSSYNDKRDDSLYSEEPRAITSDAEDCVEDPSQDEELEAIPLEKRNIAFLARNGMLPPRKSFADPFSLKRNRLSPLSSSSQLRFDLPVPKRLRSGQMRVVKMKAMRCPNTMDAKRNIAAMARKGLLPDKRNIASMARKGLLPSSGN